MVRQIKIVAGLLVALASLSLVAPPAAAQRDVTDAPEVWIHKGTGVAFPRRFGDFERMSVHEYTDDGLDASAGYDLVRDGKKIATVTVYVYPPFPIGGCSNQYADVKKSIERANAYQNVRLVSETRVASPSGRNAGYGYLASYTFDAEFAGLRQAVRSDAYLFCPAGEKWLVAYRATWLAGVDASGDVTSLFRSFGWPAWLDR